MKAKKWSVLTLICALLFTNASAYAQAADIVDLLLNAKTTQAFTDETVSDDDLNTILLAGVNAPSAMNSQPWHFSVMADDALLRELGGAQSAPPQGATPPANAPAGGMTPSAGGAKASLADAAVAIVISCSDALKWDSFDAGTACDRMAVAARALGYGTKVVAGPCDTVNNSADWLARLGIPDGMRAIAVLLIGKVDESIDGASGSTVRNPFDEVVSFVE